MSVDHCFSIRGQGTVMTGTILQGSLAINDTVEIPALKVFPKMATNSELLIFISKWMKCIHRNHRDSEVQKLSWLWADRGMDDQLGSEDVSV